MKEIFIVEDNDGIRELLELLLSQFYIVQAFPTARSFKKGMAFGHPDIVLMDIQLPDGNGFDLCKDLHKQQNTSNIPVVLMSAHADPSLFKDNCVKDFISKPFDIDDLIERVAKQLS